MYVGMDLVQDIKRLYFIFDNAWYKSPLLLDKLIEDEIKLLLKKKIS